MTDEAMPRYSGTKTLRAVKMTKAAYCSYRGWTVPENEDPLEDGYLVEYEDGGKPNLLELGHAGYVSWSPADVFEATYFPCGSHVDRMRIELAELTIRVEKLEAFIAGPGPFADLPAVDQVLMRGQLTAMTLYKNALEERLQRAS